MKTLSQQKVLMHAARTWPEREEAAVREYVGAVPRAAGPDESKTAPQRAWPGLTVPRDYHDKRVYRRAPLTVRELRLAVVFVVVVLASLIGQLL